MAGKTRHTLPTIVGLFAALGGWWLVSGIMFGFVFEAEELTGISQIAISLADGWVPAMALLALVLLWEKEPLSSIGIRRLTVRDTLWALAGFVVGAMTFVVTGPIVEALNLETTTGGIEELAAVPFAYRVAIPITAGITEEILYRGYPIERLRSLTGSLAAGAVVARLPAPAPGAALSARSCETIKGTRSNL